MAGNRSPTEKYRYLGALRATHSIGVSWSWWCNGPPRIPPPFKKIRAMNTS
jgi:hypothetical protein